MFVDPPRISTWRKLHRGAAGNSAVNKSIFIYDRQPRRINTALP